MKIYTDGFTIGKNPSKIGGGYVVMDENSKVLAMHEIRKDYFTNNEAELRGVLEAVRQASQYDEIITDSMTAYYWGRSGKCKARQDLKEIALEIKKYIKNKNLNFYQLPREQNIAGNYIEFTLQQ